MSTVDDLSNQLLDLKINHLPRENCIVYAKGSCRNNGEPNAIPGIGVWFGENHLLNVSQRIHNEGATIITAELQACIRAVYIAHQNAVKTLIIRTDCLFVIYAMTMWVPNIWLPCAWKNPRSNRDIINKEDFVELYTACKLLHNVTWEQVAKEANPAFQLATKATSD